MIKKIFISSLVIHYVLVFLVMPSMAGHKSDSDIVISIKSLLEKIIQRPDTVIVDIRDKDAFEKVRIPGSLNIPLYAIKTKTFLKSRDLVLVNQGYKYKEIDKECLRLRENGFSAQILHGGLNAWREGGQLLEGDIRKTEELNKITPKDLFLERGYGSRLIIDVTGIDNSLEEYLVSHPVLIPFDNEKSFFIRFKDLLKKQKDVRLFSILIFNEKGDQYQGIEKVIQRTNAENVFYLKGGLEAYKSYYNQQALLHNAERVRTREINGCGTCQ